MYDINEAVAEAIELIESIDRRKTERESNARNKKLPRKKLATSQYRGFPRLARCSSYSLDAESDARDLLS